MEIHAKTVLLTGSTGGIGLEISKALAAAGARLILTGRNLDRLNALKKNLVGEGHLAIAVDVASEDGVDKLVALAQTNQVDVLINNAGVNHLATHEQTSSGEITRMMTVNLCAPMILCSRLIPVLQNRTEAMIINVGSIMGSIGMAGSATYCASKFGLRGFTESLRRELADSNIRVVYFAPRMTSTAINSEQMVAMSQALGTAVDSPENVAEQLVSVIAKPGCIEQYLGWPEKLFVRINGLLPRVVDRALKKQLPTVLSYAR
ncbi:SDR family oxidoreductase [Pseudomaricurvus sp.]|uniref:SDR family oxidoreductase n=1 Tax=Pseudomaricurvus sp. TaxID=2004510 RepID=UPI003F6B9057